MHLGKLLTTVLIATFLLVGVTGVAYSGMMMGHGMEDMVGCPFMGNSAAICTMNPLEHIAAWQSVFTATVPGKVIASLLLLLLAACLILQTWRKTFRRHRDPLVQITRALHRKRLFLPSPLQEAFSNGILNPKIF